jgi:hypothetical protein
VLFGAPWDTGYMAITMMGKNAASSEGRIIKHAG